MASTGPAALNWDSIRSVALYEPFFADLTPLLKNTYALDGDLAHRCDEINTKTDVIFARVWKCLDVTQMWRTSLLKIWLNF